MRYRPSTFPIAREAWPFFFAVVIPATVCLILYWMYAGVFFLILAAYIIYFFRNPERTGGEKPEHVLSPADGKVVAAGLISHPDYPNGQALRIAVFMSLFDVHVNWAPYGGHVESASHHCGSFLNAMEDKCADVNERKILSMRTSSGASITVKLVAGLVARRIVCPLAKGDWVDRGEKIGLIRFGSRVETILPPDSILLVSTGSWVKGGQTVIAELNKQPDSSNQEKAAELVDVNA